MLYLATLANKFYQLVLTASNYPVCRGCKTADPYAAPDKPDNTRFCSECKQLGMKDPSPPEPKSVPAKGSLPDSSSAEAIREAVARMLAKEPNGIIPLPGFMNRTADEFIDMYPALPQDELMEVLDARIHDFIARHRNVFQLDGKKITVNRNAFASIKPKQRVLTSQEARQVVIEGIYDYITAYPTTKIPVNQLERKVWESYVDAGGSKGKTQAQRAGAYDDMMEALHEMIQKHPDIFPKIPGMHGGILIDSVKFSAL